MTGHEPAETALQVARDHWQLVAATAEPVEDIEGQWRIESGGRRFIVRQYSSLRSVAAIADEHLVCATASARGWPVAKPVAIDDGATIVLFDGSTWSVFPETEGAPPPLSLAHARINGRLLARLHRDLAGTFDRQRDGFGRAWELDVVVQAAGADTFNSSLASFGGRYPDLAAAVRRQRYRNLRELARLGYGELPSTVIHGAFVHDGLRFVDADLFALPSFDAVRLDAAVADVATSLAADCIPASGPTALDVALAAAFVEGYSRSRQLRPEEVEMIPALTRAAMLHAVATELAGWTLDQGPAHADTIRRYAERALPALDEATPALHERLLASALHFSKETQ